MKAIEETSLEELRKLNAKMDMLLSLYNSLEDMRSLTDVRRWVQDRRKEIMDRLGEI